MVEDRIRKELLEASAKKIVREVEHSVNREVKKLCRNKDFSYLAQHTVHAWLGDEIEQKLRKIL